MKRLPGDHHPMPLWMPWCGVICSALAFIAALLLGLESQPHGVQCDGRHWQLCQLVFGSIERLLGARPAHFLFVLSFFCAGLFFARLAWSGFRQRRADHNKSATAAPADQ